MTRWWSGLVTVLSAACLCLSEAGFSEVRADEQADQQFFRDQVAPLLEARCLKCHGPDQQKGGLRLDHRLALLKGGETGPALVPGDPEQSLLIEAVRHRSLQMPPQERLSDDDIQLLVEWITGGAPDPREPPAEFASEQKFGTRTLAEVQAHWAYLPLTTPTPPEVAANAVIQNDIDRFIQAKLFEQQLHPAPPADRRTLLRRLCFDVTGLPPTPAQIEQFLADADPHATARWIDTLLASPRFGEKWARHWLDVVRFAESDGFETNRARVNAWPYRDYVIEAFNTDKPYDQFIREQLAGDALGVDAATGFLVGGARDIVLSQDPVLTANQRADELQDMVSTTAATFLGLTLNCARCHDHKFDPILSRDYYGFVALLQGVRHGERPIRSTHHEAREQRLAELRDELAPINATLDRYTLPAGPGEIILVDDTDVSHTQPLKLPVALENITYSPGREQGQLDDPGDLARLPNLGLNYRYWSATAGTREDFFAWKPAVDGPFRIWLSWGAWTTHAPDARYVLDIDGNPATTSDQTEIASINQRFFADGSPAIPDQKRWSGFRLAGTFDLTEQSAVILRSGEQGGPTVADAVVFEQVLTDATPLAVPRLRAPVTERVNEDRFAPREARFVRFSIHACSTVEPCLDELEVFDLAGRNVALEAKATVSGTYANGESPIHQRAHLKDGRYGNSWSWISSEVGGGWAQLEFPAPVTIDRVVWSRDRTEEPQHFDDRLATGYRVEVSHDGANWTEVASSHDRLPSSFRKLVPTIQTLDNVPPALAGEVGRWRDQRQRLLEEIRSLSTVPVGYVGVFEPPGPTHRLHRGDPMQPREIVAPAVLTYIGPPQSLGSDLPEQQRRLALANWIADPTHPLTARVIVNRLWHYHFGTGLVDTPSDFGINGGRPTHPELLDWLAHELVSHGWSLKHIHRLILNSATYQQSSAQHPEFHAIDSGTRLLWRFPPRRLDAEAVRDTMLAVSGQLDLTMGGPGFDLFEPNDNYVKVYQTKAEYGPTEFRRMVYQSKPRAMLDDFFGAFDCPDAGQPAPKRTSSTTPLQALNLLNGRFSLQLADDFAKRVVAEVGDNQTRQVQRAFFLALGREPASDELDDALQLVERHGLASLCRALFNANEFLRLD